MRNVLTAGENSPRVVEHFPMTANRAPRWRQGMPLPTDGDDPNFGATYNNQILPAPAGTTNIEEPSGSRASHFHNQKSLPKRSGTASYITTGGVRITINKDNRHLNGANLTTQTEENMNLMFYDFNHNAAEIPEENQRNLLRS